MREHVLICLVGVLFLPEFIETIQDQDKNQAQKSFLRTILRDAGSGEPADFCDDDDENLLNENHVPGNCRSFDSHRCLCELNPSCEYDQESDECKPLPDCTLYDGSPSQCRASLCYYDCGTKRCLVKNDIPETCRGSCGEYCHDICACHFRNCQYSSLGSCQDFKQYECPATVFPAPYCGRRATRYLHNGVYCKNMHSRGNCDIQKTVVAVNFGGGPATDSHGVPHMTENELPPIDEHNIKLTYNVDDNDLQTTKDTTLYKHVIYADDAKRMSGRCVRYLIPICEDGFYELVVKTMEVFDVVAGEKQFNVKLGDQYVFPEVDVVKITGGRFQPLELIANFNIKKGRLTAEGVLSYQITNGNFPLAFCYSDCLASQGSFVVAAFSVSKFKRSENDNTNECELYNYDPWACRSANCRYQEDTQTCVSPESGCSMFVPELPKCSNLPLNVVFLLDSTSSYPATSATESLVFDEFPRIVEIADSIKNNHPQARFAVALFSEYSCHDFGGESCTKEHNGVKNHGEANGCYRRHFSLTGNLEQIKMMAQRDMLSILFSADGEPGIFSAMLAAQDLTMSWTRGDFPVIKIFVVVTDDGAHGYNFQANAMNIKSVAKFDGTDSCAGTLVPNRETMNDFFKRERVSFYMVVNENKYADSYKSFLDASLISSKISYIKDEKDIIAEGVEEHIQQRYLKIAEEGGCIDNVDTAKKRSCPTVQLEMLFLLDGSSDYEYLSGNKQTTTISTVFDTFQRIVKITDSLSQMFPGSKYAVDVFSEFNCGYTVPCWDGTYTPHTAYYKGCYNPVQSLTTDIELLKQRAERDKLTIEVSWNAEPAFFGAMMALENCHNNWTQGNSPTANKIIVLVTDTFLHLEKINHYYNKTAPKFDGSDSCYSTLQASAEEYNQFFHREGASFFILANNNKNILTYTSELQQNLVAYSDEYMDSPNEQIVSKLAAFITEQNTKKNKMLIEHGECEPSCKGPPVDVVYLLDSTSSYGGKGGEAATTDTSLVFDEFPKIVGASNILRQKFSRSRFGIALFSEFACSDITAASCSRTYPGNARQHDDCNGCYRRHQPLTEDLNLLNERAQRDQLNILFSIESQPALFDAVLAAQDCTMNWTRGNIRAIKVIVIITDAELHILQYNLRQKKVAAKLDGTDTCCGSLQPTKEEFNEFFAREQISIMLIAHKQTVVDSYRKVLNSTQVETGVEFIQSSASTIAEQIEKLISKQIKDKPENC